MEMTKCQYKSMEYKMHLEVLDPAIEYVVHSPYDIVNHKSVFIQLVPAVENESTYNVVETM